MTISEAIASEIQPFSTSDENFEKMYGLKNQFLHASYFKFLELEGPLSYLSGKEFRSKLPEKEEKILASISRL